MTPRRLLIVDHNAASRESLTGLLEPEGFELVLAEDGAQGLARALTIRPDLIIADQTLPDIDGLEVLETLEEAGLNIPAILLAKDDEALVSRARELGVVECLDKPPDPGALREAIQNAISQDSPPAPTPASLELESLTALRDVGQAIVSSLDLDFVLRQIVEQAVAIADAEEGVLMLLDFETEELYTRAAKSPDEETVQSLRLPVNDSIAGQVINTGTPFVAGSGQHKILTEYLVKSILYVPLYLMGQVIGVLGVSNRTVERDFPLQVVEALSILANYAAITITNTRSIVAAQLEQARFTTMLEHSSDAVVVVDDLGYVVFVNRGAAEALEVEPLDILGRSVEDAIDNHDLRGLFGELTEKSHVRGEVTLADGRTFNARLSNIETMGRMAVMQDVTYLKELDEMKTRFVTTVSHDLRSPLTAILGYVEFVGRTGELNEDQTMHIERVKSSVYAMTNLVNDLLDLGKIEAGIDRKKEMLSLKPILEDVRDNLQSRFEAKKHEVSLDYPDSLPQVLGNPLRLRQALSNLIDNAIKYTPDDGKIAIVASTADRQLIIQVRDSGIGIPLADQAHIFDEFYRSESVMGDYQGTGLGLAIVKSIVQAHEGRVWVESKLGKGTTFVIMLPSHTPIPDQQD